MTPEEFERVRKLMAAIARTRPRRTSRRRSPDPRGDVLDLRRLCRKSLRSGGEPIEQPWKAPEPSTASSSCSATSPAPWTRTRGRCSSTSTRSWGRARAWRRSRSARGLARLTPDLATRDPEAALARASEIAVDWGSGTRIGASLAEFNAVYGKRALSRGAVIVVVSDGWERDDPDLVGREMAKLARAAFAVVWVNPLKGNPEYQPLAGGMRAALPIRRPVPARP